MIAREVEKRNLILLPEKGEWLKHFNHKLYKQFNPDAPSLTRALSIRHFRTTGYRQLREFSSLGAFDYDFYVAFYDDLRNLSSEAAYKHWLLHGISEGRFHNSVTLLRGVGYPSSRIPLEVYDYFIELSGLAFVWRDIVEFLTSETLDHLMDICVKSSLTTVKELMLFFTHKGYLERAGFVVEFAFNEKSTDDATLFLMADRCRALGLRSTALKLYSALIERKTTAVWCYKHAADLALQLSGPKLASQYSKAGIKRLPGAEILRDTFRLNILGDYDNQLHLLKEMLQETSAEESKRILNRLMLDLAGGFAQLYGNLSNLKKGNKIKAVAILGYRQPEQCYDYRVRQKMEILARTGVRTRFYDLATSHGFLNDVCQYDAAIVFRASAFGNVLECVYVAEKMGLLTFFEIDDLILDSEIYPPASAVTGGLISKTELRSLEFDPILFSGLASWCDYGIASTKPIAAALSGLVKSNRTFVIENGLSKTALRQASGAISKDRIEKIVIFYGSGSRSHSGAFSGAVSDAILEVLKANNTVELAIVGPLMLDSRFEAVRPQTRRIDRLMKKEEYLAELEKASINLMPIASDRFSEAKSNIKWLEASQYGIPTIASRSVALESTMQNDEIILCSNAKEWTVGLKRLVASPELRKTIGDSARLGALARYNDEAIAKQLLWMFSELESSSIETLHRPRMRIAIVNVYFAPQAYGGATRVVLDDIEEMRRSHGSDIVVGVFTSIQGCDDPGTFRIYYAEETLVCGVKAPHSPGGHSSESDLGVEDAFRRFVKLFAPDLIHFHCIQNLSASVIDVARWERIPYVVTAHDGWWVSDDQFLMHPDGSLVTETNKWGNEERLLRLRQCLTDAAKVIVVSEPFKKIYEERIGRSVTVVENPVRPLAITSRPPGQNVVVGLIGGLGAAKGADLLCSTLRLRHFGSLEFKIVDHNAEEDASRTEFWGENRVEIVGRFSQENVYKFYEGIDVLCAPSICVESFGLSVREALCANRWVLVSDRGALSGPVKEGKNGFVLDVSDEADLINVLTRINISPSIFKKPSSGMQGGFNSSEQVEKLVGIYGEIVSRA